MHRRSNNQRREAQAFYQTLSSDVNQYWQPQYVTQCFRHQVSKERSWRVIARRILEKRSVSVYYCDILLTNFFNGVLKRKEKLTANRTHLTVLQIRAYSCCCSSFSRGLYSLVLLILRGSILIAVAWPVSVASLISVGGSGRCCAALVFL